MKQTKIVPGQAVFSMCHLSTLCGEPDAVQVSQLRACQLGQSVGLSGRKRLGGAASWSVCLLFFFFLFFFFPFLCFGWIVRGNRRRVHVIAGRGTRCLGSARVYVLLIFPKVSILQTQRFPVSFLLALIFVEIVPKWETLS